MNAARRVHYIAFCTLLLTVSAQWSGYSGSDSPLSESPAAVPLDYPPPQNAGQQDTITNSFIDAFTGDLVILEDLSGAGASKNSGEDSGSMKSPGDMEAKDSNQGNVPPKGPKTATMSASGETSYNTAELDASSTDGADNVGKTPKATSNRPPSISSSYGGRSNATRNPGHAMDFQGKRDIRCKIGSVVGCCGKAEFATRPGKYGRPIRKVVKCLGTSVCTKKCTKGKKGRRCREVNRNQCKTLGDKAMRLEARKGYAKEARGTLW